MRIHDTFKSVAFYVLFLTAVLIPLSLAAAETEEYSFVWPEHRVDGVLIITGDDGEDIDRTTPCENDGQRYPVVGNYEYNLEGFTESGNVLTYVEGTSVPRRFNIVGVMTARSDDVGSFTHFSVWLNDAEISPRSITGTFMKTANQAQGLPGFSFSVDLVDDDELEFMTWTDSAGGNITLTHFNYMIFAAEQQHL